MRVTNDTLRSAFLSAMESAQRRIAVTQEQVASGRKVNSPSDDPVAAARIAELDASLARLDQFKSNGVSARHSLGLEEESLAQVIDHLQRVRELTVQANTATLSAGDRAAVAAELRQRRDALLALANTTDSDGRYLFGGYSEGAQPFTLASGGGVVYNGDQGQKTVQISESRFVATGDSGAQIFQRIPNGNGTFSVQAAAGNTGTGVLGASTVVNPAAYVRDTYTINFVTPGSYEVRNSANALVSSGTYTAPAQSIAFLGIDVKIEGAPAAADSYTVAPSVNRDVFATINGLITTLERGATDAASRTRLHSEVGQALLDIDQASAHMIDARSEIGSRVRALDDETTLSEGFSLQLTETLSSIRDLDYAEALSRLSQQLFGLDAAQQAFARTQNLSLFRYL
jgi:flagellar hook-associated protein 3 FlgL